MCFLILSCQCAVVNTTAVTVSSNGSPGSVKRAVRTAELMDPSSNTFQIEASTVRSINLRWSAPTLDKAASGQGNWETWRLTSRHAVVVDMRSLIVRISAEQSIADKIWMHTYVTPAPFDKIPAHTARSKTLTALFSLTKARALNAVSPVLMDARFSGPILVKIFQLTSQTAQNLANLVRFKMLDVQ